MTVWGRRRESDEVDDVQFFQTAGGHNPIRNLADKHPSFERQLRAACSLLRDGWEKAQDTDLVVDLGVISEVRLHGDENAAQAEGGPTERFSVAAFRITCNGEWLVVLCSVETVAEFQQGQSKLSRQRIDETERLCDAWRSRNC